MTVARSTVNELTVTFGTVFEPELPPDDVAGVDELPQAATKRPTLHASDIAPPFRWRTIIPDPRIAASLSSVCADRDWCRWRWVVSRSFGCRLRVRHCKSAVGSERLGTCPRLRRSSCVACH